MTVILFIVHCVGRWTRRSLTNESTHMVLSVEEKEVVAQVNDRLAFLADYLRVEAEQDEKWTMIATELMKIKNTLTKWTV